VTWLECVQLCGHEALGMVLGNFLRGERKGPLPKRKMEGGGPWTHLDL
jgi:hypothetical protein